MAIRDTVRAMQARALEFQQEGREWWTPESSLSRSVGNELAAWAEKLQGDMGHLSKLAVDTVLRASGEQQRLLDEMRAAQEWPPKTVVEYDPVFYRAEDFAASPDIEYRAAPGLHQARVAHLAHLAQEKAQLEKAHEHMTKSLCEDGFKLLRDLPPAGTPFGIAKLDTGQGPISIAHAARNAERYAKRCKHCHGSGKVNGLSPGVSTPCHLCTGSGIAS